MRSGLLALAVLLLGCGSKPSDKPTTKEEDKADKKPPMDIQMSKASAEQYSADGKSLLWMTNWESLDMNVTSDNTSSGKMHVVTGSLYQEGKPTTDFSGDEGTADQSRQLLELSNHVKLISRTQSTTLTATKMSHEARKKLVVASGGVKVDGKAGKAGVFDKLYASVDLKRIGTQDHFEKVLVLNNNRYSATSADEKMTLQFGSFLRTEINPQDQSFDLRKDVLVTAKPQGLTLHSQTANLLASNGFIKQGQASGGVEATLESVQKGDIRTTRLNSASSTLKQSNPKSDLLISMPSRTTIVESSAANGQMLKTTGSSGNAVFGPEKQGLKTAALAGSVQIDLKVLPNPKQKGGKVTATGDRMVIVKTGENSTVTLTGHVQMKGTNSAYQAMANVEKLVLYLNSKFEITRWSAGGQP